MRPDPEEDRDEPRGEEPRGTVRPTGPAPLVTVGVVGLVAGWALRPLALRLGYVEPVVTWLSVNVLFFVAAIVGASAYLTRRTVRRDRFALANHQAVNRLVLAKACAIVGALLVGGYVGYAVSQLGQSDPGSVTRLWRSGLAALGGAALTAASLLLEAACRVPRRED